jgi:coenzyme F420-0:L-glutamate ligase/coenzyme F420-1:gamma-L-glutamate ligase
MARQSTEREKRAASSSAATLTVSAIPGLPEVHEGDDLAMLIPRAAKRARIELQDSDIVVVAQKIVSKAEGRVVRLSEVKATARARELAKTLRKDARLVELILRETRRILRSERVLIVETHHGLVCANAGIDHSNVPGKDRVALLPKDPDGSARRLAGEIGKRTGKRVAVIVSDTFGRPWRLGLTNVAIGAAGLPALLDLRGQRDRNRKLLQATVLAVADELASAAGLLMQKSAGMPVVVIRGYRYRLDEGAGRGGAAVMIRPAKDDLFR